MPVTVVVSSFKAAIEPLPFQMIWRKFDTVPTAGTAPSDALRLAMKNWPSLSRNTTTALPDRALNMNTRALFDPFSIMSNPPEAGVGGEPGKGAIAH